MLTDGLVALPMGADARGAGSLSGVRAVGADEATGSLADGLGVSSGSCVRLVGEAAGDWSGSAASVAAPAVLVVPVADRAAVPL